MLLVSWPVPLLVGLLLYRVGELAGRWAAMVLLALWLLSAIPLLRPPRPSSWISDPRLPRRPTSEESVALDPAWSDTVHRLGLDESCYDLLVREDGGPIGAAYPGGGIIVTTEAVTDLSPAELRGLLGHEIGHFLGDGGGTLYRLSRWYSGPLTAPPKAVWRRLLRLFSVEWARHAVVWFVQLGWLAGLAVLLDNCFGPAVTVGFGVAASVQGLGQYAVLRRNQFHADRVAIDLGFGPGLASLMRRRNPPDAPLAELVNQRRPLDRAVAFLARSLLSDPVPEQRIVNIEAYVNARELSVDR